MSEHQQTQQSKNTESSSQRRTIPASQNQILNPAYIIQRARINPKSLIPADFLQLQRTIGNRAVGRLLSEIRNPSMVQQVPIQMQEIPEEDEPLQGKMIETVQRQEVPEEEKPIQGKMIGTIQRQEIPEEEESFQIKRGNSTGMPDNLKAGVESLSGIDMSDVRVHYNSLKPAEVGALAYTQGTDTHVAPGQERHLPHEAWHVVQQTGKIKRRVEPQSKTSNVMQAKFKLSNDGRIVTEQMLKAAGMSYGLLESFRQMELEQGTSTVSVTNMQQLTEILQKRYGRDAKGAIRSDQTMLQKKMVDLCKDRIISKFSQDPEIVSEYFDTVDMCAGHSAAWDKDPVGTMHLWEGLTAWDGTTTMDEAFKQQVFYHMQIAMKEQLREDPQSQREEEETKRDRYAALEALLLPSQEASGNQAKSLPESTCKYTKGDSFESIAHSALKVLENMPSGNYAIETDNHAMRITWHQDNKILFDPAAGIVPIRTRQGAVTGLAEGARHGWEDFELEESRGMCPEDGEWHIRKIS